MYGEGENTILLFLTEMPGNIYFNALLISTGVRKLLPLLTD